MATRRVTKTVRVGNRRVRVTTTTTTRPGKATVQVRVK